MPVCFQLTKKGETKPSAINDIDKDLWDTFADGEPEGNDKYFANWYNTVGMMLAMGKTWEEIKEVYKDNDISVIEYLEENYSPYAWREHRV